MTQCFENLRFIKYLAILNQSINLILVVIHSFGIVFQEAFAITKERTYEKLFLSRNSYEY